jgi:hypothetical protein
VADIHQRDAEARVVYMASDAVRQQPLPVGQVSRADAGRWMRPVMVPRRPVRVTMLAIDRRAATGP